jgi:hypothetical protein
MVNTNENKVSAGRVLIKPRGEWNENITYEMLDMVNHKGCAYLAKRTVVGIEPSDDHPEYWHNMLEIDKIVKEAIAGTLAEDVGNLLEERFRDMLSEARYVEDLLAEFDAPTFVHWNAETNNTPYTAGLTSSSEGYALVYGNSISAWANGETFTYGANGWDKPINASGGTMSGPLGLGGGKGIVSADEDGTFIEVKNGDDVKQIKVTNTSLEEAAKLVSKLDGVTKEYNLFGEHNPDKMSEIGIPRVYFGSYVGDGRQDITVDLKIKNPKAVIFGGGYTTIAFYGQTNASVEYKGSLNGTANFTWNENLLTITQISVDFRPLNVSNNTYPFMVIY